MNIGSGVLKAREGTRKRAKDGRLVQIYRGAAAIIHQKGYDATSLQDIAEAVGLTKAGLYHYIQSKEQLLYEIMNYGMDRVESVVVTPALAVADPAERMRTLAANYANLIIEHGQSITIILSESTGLSAAHLRKVLKRRRAFYESVRDTIQQLKDAGNVEGLDVSVTSLSVFGVMMWLAHWYQPDGRLSREEVVDQITELTVVRMLGLPKT
jgi:TetR/AcrR family transcriptional regulator, cholesterol catabolism regulator